MALSENFLYVVFGCALVTWIPRILPFIFSRRFTFPKWLDDFLSFIPMCILTALLVQNMLIVQPNHLPKIHWTNLLVSLPTLGVALYTKNLMWTVLVGILTMALFRFVF